MTTDGHYFDQFFARRRVLVILRGHSVERTLELCGKAAALGIDAIEVTVQDDTGLQALRSAVQWAHDNDRVVGAGTVTSLELLDAVVSAGAEFTVAPNTDAEIILGAAARGTPHLPGVATATEVHRARQLGCRWQKVFPASVLGAEWLTAMRGPFPDVRFVATGGLTTSNARAFADAGAVVSLGSAFADTNPALVRALVRDSELRVTPFQ